MEKPLEQLYGLQVAAELIPMSSVGALYQFLHHHKAEFPGRYSAAGWRGKRVLTESEILKIRDMIYNVTRHHSAGGAGRWGRREPNIIDTIIRKATA